MKKVLGFIISLVMMFLAVGCSDNNTDPLPIIPGGSNSDTSGDSNDTSPDSNTGCEGDDTSGKDDSSSDKDEDKPSNGSGGWTGDSY